MMHYNQSVQIYLNVDTNKDGFTQTTEQLQHSHTAQVQFKTKKKAVSQNGNLAEIVSSVTIIIPKRFNRDFLKQVKEQGFILLDNEKFLVIDFAVSDILPKTVLYGVENG